MLSNGNFNLVPVSVLLKYNLVKVPARLSIVHKDLVIMLPKETANSILSQLLYECILKYILYQVAVVERYMYVFVLLG